MNILLQPHVVFTDGRSALSSLHHQSFQCNFIFVTEEILILNDSWNEAIAAATHRLLLLSYYTSSETQQYALYSLQAVKISTHQFNTLN